MVQRSNAARRPPLVYITVASVLAALLWVRWGGIRKGIWIDLDVYIRGAGAVIRHEPLYSVSVQGQYFTYPPFAAVFFVPLELLGDFGARLALTLASIGCYVVVVVVCARRLRMNVAAAAIVGLIGLSLEPFARTFLLGQINLVLLALVVIDCLVVLRGIGDVDRHRCRHQAPAWRVYPFSHTQTGVVGGGSRHCRFRCYRRCGRSVRP